MITMLFNLMERNRFFSEKAKKIKNKKLWGAKGCQVVMAARNAEEWLPITLASINNAMRNFEWIMHFGDDNSDDNTYKIAKSFSKHTSAKKFNLFKFNKAKTIAEAKNRVIKESLKYSHDYPAIFMADADDFFTQERPIGLLEVAKSLNAYFLVGSWYYCTGGEKLLRNASESIKKNAFGPWTTLMHADLIPETGKLFYENMDAHEDIFLWDEFKAASIEIVPVNSIVACYYNARQGTVSKPVDLDKKIEELKKYQYLKSLLCNEKV